MELKLLSDTSLIKVSCCPTCQKPLASSEISFCSPTCEYIDLGIWLRGEYCLQGDTEEEGTASYPEDALTRTFEEED